MRLLSGEDDNLAELVEHFGSRLFKNLFLNAFLKAFIS